MLLARHVPSKVGKELQSNHRRCPHRGREKRLAAAADGDGFSLFVVRSVMVANAHQWKRMKNNRIQSACLSALAIHMIQTIVLYLISTS